MMLLATQDHNEGDTKSMMMTALEFWAPLFCFVLPRHHGAEAKKQVEL
jgi:hypothetical protein